MTRCRPTGEKAGPSCDPPSLYPRGHPCPEGAVSPPHGLPVLRGWRLDPGCEVTWAAHRASPGRPQRRPQPDRPQVADAVGDGYASNVSQMRAIRLRAIRRRRRDPSGSEQLPDVGPSQCQHSPDPDRNPDQKQTGNRRYSQDRRGHRQAVIAALPHSYGPHDDQRCQQHRQQTENAQGGICNQLRRIGVPLDRVRAGLADPTAAPQQADDPIDGPQHDQRGGGCP